MRELFEAIPDPDVVLALEPEELGAKIIFLLRRRIKKDQRDKFHSGNLIGEVMTRGDTSRGQSGYPKEKWDELGRAVSEAFAWLEAQGLIVATPDQMSAQAGWRILSRRARKFENEKDFYQFQLVKMLPRKLLHPSLSESIWMSFIRGEFDVAVFHAMKQVEVAVRDAAGFGAGDHGVQMIRRALHKDSGPLRDADAEEAEREALAHLFAGAIGSYKNPHSHRNVPLDDPTETFEIIMLANHLLRIVEARK